MRNPSPGRLGRGLGRQGPGLAGPKVRCRQCVHMAGGHCFGQRAWASVLVVWLFVWLLSCCLFLALLLWGRARQRQRGREGGQVSQAWPVTGGVWARSCGALSGRVVRRPMHAHAVSAGASADFTPDVAGCG